ncbi:hypothetical protein [Pseudothauera rhizosphaerae]|uniref:Uncharacterized protein n=1 Tax=Pseudothauera rhizosphaerae TaxID=2565932 RepID=A0A4S4AWG5_9RHOO|nr:hypothetical protein [Pseudothauera rhizosphaerae]THF64341.1 hypothetical protein E6O51_03250 [Pseudothauera rhizosphaerae]
MSGGIDWFRWHHGSVTDPKFRVIARRCGHSLATVIAVWAAMLECASASSERGTLVGWDDEDAAAGLDMDAQAVSAIREAMQGKTLDGLSVTGWGRRQPKREDGSAARAKDWRERKALEKAASSEERTQTNANERTPNEERTQTNAREEERRVNPLPSVGGAGGVQADLLTEPPDASPPAPPLDEDELPFAADHSAGYGPGAEAAPPLQGMDPPRRTRGARLPADWALPKPWGEWALAEQPTWTPEHVRWVADNFRDYWLGRAGKDAVKVDWQATWRTWVRKEAPLINGARASPGRPGRRSLLTEMGLIGGSHGQ